MSGNQNLLYIHVKQGIMQKISTMQAGQRIPSRNKLIEEFGVTRTTIDRAISELVGEGYLYTRDGSGTYKSNDIAPRPQSEESSVISWGVILPNIMQDTYPGILRGVEDVASQNGINVMICNTDNQIEKQNMYLSKLLDSYVKGIIIVPAIEGVEHDFHAFHQLRENQIPFVFCNRVVTGIDAPKVISNNFYGAFLSTNHLIRQGYRHIGYISRPAYSTSLERYQGYISAFSQAGLQIDQNRVVFEQSFLVENAGYDSTKALLARCPDTDAIFCFNDELARGACQALEEMNLRIGRDVGVVGYDDTSICEKLRVKLSSVRFKTYEAGSMAAQILLRGLSATEKIDNDTVILQPELIVRESSTRA